MSLREIKARARADLHEAMRVGAHYFADIAAAPVACGVRVHSKNAALGDLKGTSFSYAETVEFVPKLLFWLAEVDPHNDSFVVVSASEGYRVNHVEPPDGATVTGHVTQLDAPTLAALFARVP